MSKYAFEVHPGVHAKLSASSAERWLTCPGSVALSEGLPNVSTFYAAQGTAAHYIAAEEQRSGRMDAMPWFGQTAWVEGHEIKLDAELIEAVQEFLDYLKENERTGDVAYVEQSFTPAMQKLLDKEFGGSTDRVMYRAEEKLLRVYDYKHGAGVPVDVDENKQLKYYALGALLTNPQWVVEDVELVIAQPRCEHSQGRIRGYKFKAFDLLEYAADLIEGANATRGPLAPLKPSTKACKFCPANAARKCSAIEQETQAIVQAAFGELAIERYSPAQIAEFLTKAPLVEQQISAVREFAYQQALHHGVDFPGWKLVEKRATRHWRDEDAAREAFGNLPGALTAPEIRSPAQIEKLVGKKKFGAHAAELVEKKSSGYTLTPVEDNRPAITPILKVLELFEPEAPEQS